VNLGLRPSISAAVPLHGVIRRDRIAIALASSANIVVMSLTSERRTVEPQARHAPFAGKAERGHSAPRIDTKLTISPG
jgi:hypothetical protein